MLLLPTAVTTEWKNEDMYRPTPYSRIKTNRVQVKRHALENVLIHDSKTAMRFWQNTVYI